VPSDKKFYIHTGKDGLLEDTSEADVLALVEDLRNSKKIVLHLHGGLVSKDRALEMADRLVPSYLKAGARPIFMVWESGFLETISHNLHEIDKERIFALLVKKILKYAVGKLTDTSGAKATGQLLLPRDLEVTKEFIRRRQDETPFVDVEPITVTELTQAERNRFENDLATDIDFQEASQAIVDGARPTEAFQTVTAKGVKSMHRRSAQTLMSPEVVEELVADAAEKEGKGIFSTAALIVKAGKILKRVIERFVSHRDHGIYATVMEEVLREFYVANVGAAVWGMMKQDTADTFAQFGEEPKRAGWFLVQELGRMMRDGHQPEVSVVAHSAGAIYACHLLAHLDWARFDPTHPLPTDFKLKNLIFLAPACDFSLFDRTLTRHRQNALFEHFRMFALSDRLESGYWEVPGVYPRSLLYFVSGVVERIGDESAYDMPLVGMQRYFTNSAVYSQSEVERVRQFLALSPDRRSEVWSEEDRGPGLVSDAIRHGAFADTGERSKTIAAVQQLLQEGW
jgi:hypothetical protein